ncbi:hypothetical protein MQE23_00040 [Streptomyces sp. HP-A2021]|uniref:hypothetical protein n=1 Tax=Streptomyces sp. HP-A2021 TaxID=2927875 RepID=UPI001FAF3089|nr:hypothetical protein [Streptomyces sp. HP-A2021]UOB07602.1 hypothetical protein MQE23_00040 [Streptomyces sp. HP-A2021]
MSGLVNGKWVNGDVAAEEIKNGAFHREETNFGKPTGARSRSLPAFCLYLYPWASRTLIFRKLKGLENIISLVVASIADDGWEFATRRMPGEHVGEIHYLPALHRQRARLYRKGIGACAVGSGGDAS